MKKLVSASTAAQFGEEMKLAGKMGEAANCLVMLDIEHLKAYPVSEEFHAVIEEVSVNDIEYADFYGVQAPAPKTLKA